MAFVKRRADAPPGFFAAEAAGLRWLAGAGPGSARTAEVIEVGATAITLVALVPGRPSRTAAADFGRALAVTHAAGSSAFGSPPAGWDGDAWIGRQAMSLRPEARWGVFYAEQRLLPYARAALERGNLSVAGLDLVDQVCARLIDGEFDDDRPPARIHGDLWSGNVMFTAAGVVIIDPAAHGGHGLTDLAMLELFGAPYLDTITTAYAETADLDRGWPELIGLHQLHPLLVHAVSHGPSYGSTAEQVARRYA